MALQFACVVELPGSKTKGKGKVKGDATVVLEAITRREQSLVLFHLMGKVLYNKRAYLLYLYRCARLNVSQEREIRRTRPLQQKIFKKTKNWTLD